MAKKRPTLDAFLNLQADNDAEEHSSKASGQSAETRSTKVIEKKERKVTSENVSDSPPKSDKHEIVRHMLYLPLPVYDQLQGLIYEEQRGQAKRRKTHDYLLDAIDLLFKKKGLKSIAELTKKDS